MTTGRLAAETVIALKKEAEIVRSLRATRGGWWNAMTGAFKRAMAWR